MHIWEHRFMVKITATCINGFYHCLNENFKRDWTMLKKHRVELLLKYKRKVKIIEAHSRSAEHLPFNRVTTRTRRAAAGKRVPPNAINTFTFINKKSAGTCARDLALTQITTTSIIITLDSNTAVSDCLQIDNHDVKINKSNYLSSRVYEF